MVPPLVARLQLALHKHASSSVRPYRDTFLDYPSDSQHVWLRRDWPYLAVLHAVWDRGAYLYRIPDTGFSLHWWATHSWKPYRA